MTDVHTTEQLDHLVRTVSAFGGWDDLKASLDTGYTPTVPKDSPDHDALAQAIVAEGFDCFRGSGHGFEPKPPANETVFPTDDNPVCPFCGEWYWERGLDATFNPSTGEHHCDWVPCCEGMRDAVGHYGWEGVFGSSLEDDLVMCVGLHDPREVYLEDSLIRFSLEGYVPSDEQKKKKKRAGQSWQQEVFADIDEHHLHHDAPQGWKFGVAVYNGGVKVGVAIVGRPVSRRIQEAQPGTLEVTRVCCFGDRRLRRNAASKLYAECARAAKQLGYDKLITYTLDSEDGASLKAANWTPMAASRGGSWSRKGRGRDDKAPTCAKTRWELGLTKKARKRLAAAA